MDFLDEYKNLSKCVAAELENYLSGDSPYSLESILLSIDERIHFLENQENLINCISFPQHFKKKGMGEIWRFCHDGDVDFAINLFLKRKNIDCKIENEKVLFGNRVGLKKYFHEKVDSNFGTQNIFTFSEKEFEEYKYFFLYDEKIFFGWCSFNLIDKIKFEYENNIAITQKTCYNDCNNVGLYEELQK